MPASTSLSPYLSAQGVTEPSSVKRARVGLVLFSLAALALLAGCGSGEEQGHDSKPSSSASSPLLPKAPAAANGTDLAACKDATCQVRVAVGDELPIDAKFGLGAITVKAVGDQEVTLALKGSAGGLNVEGGNASSSVNCVNGKCTDTGEFTLTTDKPGRVNGVQISLTSTQGGRAVLKLAPA